MMYTPTPVARRPRPPGAITRGKLSSKPRSSTLTTSSLPSLSRLLATLSPTASSQSHTTFSEYAKGKQELSRSGLSRISASPSEVGDVSLGLDVGVEWDTGAVKRSAVDLGIPTALSMPNTAQAEAVPSPPPPYGQELPTDTRETGFVAVTPPRSSIPSRRAVTSPMMPSRSKTEERLRARRAKDAAKAIGLDMDFGEGTDFETDREGSGSGSGSEIDDLSPREVRRRLREMRRTVKRREDELRMTAHIADKALRQHEQVVAFLPSSVKARMPQLVNFAPGHSPASRRYTAVNPTSSHLMHSRTSSTSSITPPKLRQPSTYAMSSPALAPQTSTTTRHSGDPSNFSATFPDCNLESSGDFSSPDSSRPFQTFRPSSTAHQYPLYERKASRTKLFSYHPTPAFRLSSESSPHHPHLSALRQAEDDERILALQAALTDAREGEEAQRKLAARLRKNFDKLQREYDRTEERMDQDLATTLGVSVGIARDVPPQPWRTRERTIDKDLREEYFLAREERLNKVREATSRARGKAFVNSTGFSTALPQPIIPSEGLRDLEVVTERLGRLSVDSLPAENSLDLHLPATRYEADQCPSSSEVPTLALAGSPMRTSTHGLALPLEAKKLRKKVSQSSFASPAQTFRMQKTRSRPLSPLSDSIRQSTVKPTCIEPGYSEVSEQSACLLGRLPENTVNYSESSTGHRISAIRPKLSSRSPLVGGGESSSIRGLPFPRFSRFGGSPFRPSDSQASSIAPDFASLSSRMASMRAYVSSNLDMHPTNDLFQIKKGGRTLGAELGLGFGEDWADPLDNWDDMLGIPSGSSPLNSNGEEDEETDGSILYQSAAPLPPSVSAALSTLADVLAPTSIFATDAKPSIPVDTPAIDPTFDYTSFEVLSEVVRVRQIKWADDVPSTTIWSGVRSALDNDIVASASKQPMGASPTHVSYTDIDISRGLSLTAAKPRIRPRMDKRSSSNGTDSSFALAHRRRASQPAESLAKMGETEVEPTTIPGRVMNDLLYWLVVLVEWIEWAVVLMVRVVVILRYGKKGHGSLGRTRRRKRYYI